MRYSGTFLDGATNQSIERELTDDEVVATFSPQLVLSASAAQVPADSTSIVTISVQLASLPLSDNTRRPIPGAREVPILEDGEREIIPLDANGHAEFDRAFAAPGDYVFEPGQGLEGVSVTVKAV